MSDTLHPVGDDEISSIVTLINDGFAVRNHMSGPLITSGTRTTEATFRQELAARPNSVLLQWIPEPGQDRVGCVRLSQRSEEDGSWFLSDLVTDSKRQGEGLGRKLLDTAEQWARERGAKTMGLNVVNVREELISWYKRRGYLPTGEVQPFSYHLHPAGDILIQDLTFIYLRKDLHG